MSEKEKKLSRLYEELNKARADMVDFDYMCTLVAEIARLENAA